MPFVVDYSPVKPAMQMGRQAGSLDDWWKRFQAGQDVSLQDLRRAQQEENIRATDIQHAMGVRSQLLQEKQMRMQEQMAEKQMQAEAQQRQAEMEFAANQQAVADQIRQDQFQQQLDLETEKARNIDDYYDQQAQANQVRAQATQTRADAAASNSVSVTRDPEYQNVNAQLGRVKQAMAFETKKLEGMIDPVAYRSGLILPRQGFTQEQINQQQRNVQELTNQARQANDWLLQRASGAGGAVSQQGGTPQTQTVTIEDLEKLASVLYGN